VTRTGPAVARAKRWAEWAQQSRLGRSLVRYTARRGNRLAGAVSFYGFLLLFPLAAVVGTIAAGLLTPEEIARIDASLGANGPLSLQWVVENSASITLGAVAGAVIFGLLWVDALRGAVLGMWDVHDEPAPTVKLKVLDLITMLVVGVITALSVGATVVVTAVLDWLIRTLAFATEVSIILAQVVGLSAALAFATVLFVLLLAVVPRLTLPWRPTLAAALLAGAVFQLANVGMTYYLAAVARRSYYLGFGVPIALLVYLYVVSRILMAAAAWMVEGTPAEVREEQARRVAEGYGAHLVGARAWRAALDRLPPIAKPTPPPQRDTSP
jgi:membrane protein